MAITGKGFTFNGRSSEEFKVILGSEGPIEEYPMGVSRSAERGEITKYRATPNFTGALYEDVLEFEIELIRDYCRTDEATQKFTRSEINAINAWLTSPRFPKLFHIIDYDEDVEKDLHVDYFATISTVETSAYGDIYSLRYTVTCDAPYGYSEEIVHNLSNTGNVAETTVAINSFSAEMEMDILPTIMVYPHSSGQIILGNKTQQKELRINVLADVAIEINSRLLSFKDETGKIVTLEDLGIKDIGDIYWPSLSYGENIISLLGDADITIKYREPRKVGAY